MRIKDSKHILIKLLARLWVSAGLITTFTSLAQAQTQVFNDIDVHKKVFQQTQTEKQIKAQTFSCTEIGHNSFFGCYYASKNLINLSAVKTEKELNFNWPDSPVAGVSPVFASAQFKGRFVFEAGIYEFNLTSTNKSYLFIDGASVLDASNTESSKTFAVTKNVKAGQHLIEIRYYRESKEAVLKLDWKKKLGLISSLTLVNAVSNQDIRELKNGDTINLRQDGNKLSVRANISGSVGSVNFDLDGVIKIDNSAHYVYPANVGSDYFSFTPTLGVHLLTVKPFSKARGRGDEGATFSIGFKVISGVVSPATSNTNIPATVANPKPLPLPATSPSPTSIDVMSLATLSPCKSDTCTVSGPVRVTKSGTVIKNLKISNPQGACLIIAAENVRIENSEIGPCLTQGILVQASGATIIRNYIHDTFREGIYTFNTSGLMVQNNRFETISAGVRAVVGQRVVIDRNFIKNVMGTSGTGNIVQFDKVHGAGNRVTCNIGFNEIGRSKSEDLINIYGSVGTAQDPIQIIGNKLKGGGPSLSGGGILLGDAGGAYAIAKDNILVDPGQYGIGIVGGHHQTLTNNIVYGKSQSFTNVGIQVWDFYKIGNCSSNIVSYNLINFINASNHQNDFWTNDSCKPISGVDTNIWKARIDETVFESDIEFCR